jgi:hypothetical protein
MFGLPKLANAFANLAGSINALAAVIDAATGRLRQQLALDGGEVLDHEPLPAPESQPDGQGRKGRGKPAA